MPEDDWVINILMAGCWINLATYTFVLGFSLHNAVKFLVRKKRWKNFYLMGFYALTVLVALTRIFYFYSLYRTILTEKYEPAWSKNVYY